MKNNLSLALALLASAVALVGCGRSREEIEHERKRLEMEEQSQRDLQKANKAIGELGKKIGRKVPLYDLGLPPTSNDKKIEPVPEATRKP